MFVAVMRLAWQFLWTMIGFVIAMVLEKSAVKLYRAFRPLV